MFKNIMKARLFKNVSRKTKKKMKIIVTFILAFSLFLSNLPIQNFFEVVGQTNNNLYKKEKKEKIKNYERDVVYELREKRDQYSKVFLKDDYSYEKVIYDEPVHFLKNNEWVDINNSLTLNKVTSEYENKDNAYKIKLPKEIKDNKRFKLDFEGYKIEWSLRNSLVSNIDIQKQNIKSDDPRNQENIHQSIMYSNVLENVNLEYILKGEEVKENIILNQYIENFSLTFDYKIKGLSISYNDSGNLIFVDGNKEILHFDSLYMIDAKGEISEDVQLSITEQGNHQYEIKIIPNDEWIRSSERQFPIKIDPTIKMSHTSTTSIRDKYVIKGSSNPYDNSFLKVGNRSSTVYRSYLEFDLSQFLDTKIINYALLELNVYSKSCSSVCQINLYGVSSSENYTDITGSNLPNLEGFYRIFDYENLSNSDKVYDDILDTYNNKTTYFWDFTKLMQIWVSNKETKGTVELRNNNENLTSNYVYFNSSSVTSIPLKPVVKIGFNEQVGIEDYWTYHTQNAGEAGIGYVNDYTGNLTFINTLYQTSTERNSYSLQHVYNYVNRNVNKGYGYGWSVNFDQRIFYDKENNLYYHLDGDGTKQYYVFDEKKDCTCFIGGTGGIYFYNIIEQSEIENDGICGLAENGTGTIMRLSNSQTDSNGEVLYYNTVKLFDKNYNIKEFELISGGQDTDREYILKKVRDYTSYNKTLDKYENELVITHVTINNGQNYVIDRVTDAIGNYNKYLYSNNLLVELQIVKKKSDNKYSLLKWIEFKYGSGTPYLDQVIHYYIGSASEGINDYDYDNDYGLTQAKNSTTPGVSYQYNSLGQVKTIQQFNGSSLGEWVDITYATKATTFTDVYGKSIRYTFDNYGHTVNVADSNGNAKFLAYQNIYDYKYDDFDIFMYNQNHKLISESNTKKDKFNPVKDYSFEDLTFLSHPNGWYIYNGSANGTTIHSNDGVFGNSSFMIVNTVNSDIELRQDLVLDKGIYTLSGLIKNPNNTTGAYLAIENYNSQYITLLESSPKKIYNQPGWQYYFIEFEVTQNNTPLTIALQNEVTVSNQDSTSSANFDNIHINRNYIEEENNMILDDSFEDNSSNWVGYFSNVPYAARATVFDEILGDRAARISGQLNSELSLWQSIDINHFNNMIDLGRTEDGQYYIPRGTNIVFGGWAEAKMLPDKENYNRKLQIQLIVTDVYGYENTYKIDMNSEVDDWQQKLDSVILTDDIVNLKIRLVYQGTGYAYFDNIQLYIEEFGNKYHYSEFGNLIGVTDPKGKMTDYCYAATGSGECFYLSDYLTYASTLEQGYENYRQAIRNESYYRVELNNVLGVKTSDGLEIRYTYDDLYKLTTQSFTDKTNKTYQSSFGYNENGQLLVTQIGDLHGEYIEQTNYYDENSFNQYLDKYIDEFGNEVDIDYNAVNGLLDEVKNYNSSIKYDYDDFGYLETVKGYDSPEPATDTPITSNRYTYHNGLIEKIYVNDFIYYYTYDDFGNVIKVQLFDSNENLINTLMTNNYETVTKMVMGEPYVIQTGKLLSKVFGNNSSIVYSYNDDQVVDGMKDYSNRLEKDYRYVYNSLGQEVIVVEQLSSQNSIYYYNKSNNLEKVLDEQGNVLQFGYDETLGYVNEYIQSLFGVTISTEFLYDENTQNYDQTTFKTVNGRVVVKDYQYSTDALNRLETIQITIDGQKINIDIEYDDSSVVHGNSTTRIKKIELSKNDLVFRTMTYNYDEVGNIKQYVDKDNSMNQTLQYNYKYDSLNQLLREDIHTPSKQVTKSYEYENHGNIQYVREYNYTDPMLEISGTPISIIKYFYDSEWKDQLKRVSYVDSSDTVLSDIYNSSSYDGQGNPVYNNEYYYYWKGRELTAVFDRVSLFATYKYNDQGIRIYKKTHYGEYTYQLNGDKVIYEEIKRSSSTDKITYTYDVDGKLFSMIVNKNNVTTEYWYMRNLQGDIIALLDNNGTQVVKYTYDAWGNKIDTYDNSGIDLAKLNPYCYRGYRYDEETGWYYLNSRYYNPEIGRFINSDGLIGEIGDILGHNMYSYCGNNPVMRVDPSGYAWWNWALSGAAVVGGTVLCFVPGMQVIGVGFIVGGTSGLVSNTMDALGVDSKLACQISAGIDIIGGTALLFTPFASVGASMIGSGVGSFAGGYISEGLGGSYELGSFIGSIGGGIAGGKIADTFSTRYLNNIVTNPSAIEGQSLTKVKMATRLSSKYKVGVMQRSKSNPYGGFTATNKMNVSYGYIQYHPGTLRHYNGAPYWKVTSSFNKAKRFPY
ncbi:DNRLRE domain-containing protein [Mycoplasmatota bacterium]|nr:DNRLRE domain-containing protein [Mycoplasmatota bacterium]